MTAQTLQPADPLNPCADCSNFGSVNCRHCSGENANSESFYWAPLSQAPSPAKQLRAIAQEGSRLVYQRLIEQGYDPECLLLLIDQVEDAIASTLEDEFLTED